MTGATAQLWVVGACVALALGYTVWAAVRKVKRVQAGGAACGGCSGDGCGSGGSNEAGVCANGGPTSVQARPVSWHPPARRAALTGQPCADQPAPGPDERRRAVPPG